MFNKSEQNHKKKIELHWINLQCREILAMIKQTKEHREKKQHRPSKLKIREHRHDVSGIVLQKVCMQTNDGNG